MEEKKKNNGVLIGLLVGIIIMLLAFILLFETKTISLNTKTEKKESHTKESTNKEVEPQEEKQEEQQKETIYTKEEILNMTKGIWTHFNSNSRYMLNIKDNGFGYGRYQTDGGIYGEITDIKYISNNIYELTVFSQGCHESNGEVCMYEQDDETYSAKLDISEINSKKIKLNIDGNNYYTLDYIGASWEEVENNLN